PATATTTAAATTRRSPTPTIKLDVPATTNITTDPELKTADHRAGRSSSPIITEDPPTTETYNLRSALPAPLSSQLQFKLMTQMNRYQLIENICAQLHQSDELLDASMIKEHASNVDATHKAFLKEHAYFEVSWPFEHLNHNY
ncbi:hypothetical protein PV325_013643, partial [Microctonus aethiopoides]